MARLLSKLFNIRPAEWPRLLLLYLMFLVFIIGWTWGALTLEAAFLGKLGVAALPWLFVIKAIFSIPASAIYSAFADRVAHNKLLITVLGVGSLGIGISLILLEWGLAIIAYPLLYLVLFILLDDIISVHWHTYVNSFYDTQSAKRVIPVLVTSIGIGSIIAGRTISILNQSMESNQIFMAWLSTLVVMALLVWLMPYFLKEGKTAKEQPGLALAITSPVSRASQRPAYLDNLREGYHYVLQSTYLRWLALAALLLMILFTFLQFQTSAILLDELKTEKEYANFTGYLTWVANLIMLPLQLLLLNRIIGRMGLGNANLIFPALTLFTSGSLVFAPRLFTAALAYLNRTKIHANIGYPIDSLLYNAVPLRVKGRARAFIGGLIVPVGSGVGGMLLLLLPLLSTTWLPAALVLILAIAYVASAWVIRQQYSQALIQMLEQEDFSFLLAQDVSNLTVTDPATLNTLRQKLEASKSYEFSLFLAKLISQFGGKEAVSILGQAAHTTSDARQRAAIIDVLVAADALSEAARQLYTDFLADSDGRVRQSALTGLSAVAGSGSRDFLSLALQMLADPDVEVRAYVLPALLRADDPAYQTPATQTLQTLLNHEDAQQRLRGIRVLRQANDIRFVDELAKYSTDPADEVRLEVALALETLAAQKIPLPAVALVLDAVDPWLRDPIQRVRQAALIILGRLGTYEHHEVVTGGLTDPSPQVRATAIEVLTQIGKAAIPTVHAKLDSPDPQVRKMTTIVLSRINRREFSPLVTSHIIGNLLAIYRTYGYWTALLPCQQYPGILLMQSALQERQDQLVAEIFYLLEAIHDPGAIKIVAESLRSDAARVRANAVEALETLTTPHTAQLIAPLFEPGLAPAKLLEIGQDTWEMQHPNSGTAMSQLLADPHDPWSRAMMAYALGEMGAALASAQANNGLVEATTGVAAAPAGNNEPASPEAASEPTSPPEKRKEHRFRPADLLDALTELGERDKPPAPAERPGRPRPANLLGALANSDQSKSLPEEKQAVSDSQPSSPPKPLTATPPGTDNDLIPFTLPIIQARLQVALTDPNAEVRLAAQAAKRLLSGQRLPELRPPKEGIVLSTIEKIIFLKEVPFFQGMTIDQLKVLANVCEEAVFEEDTHIFDEDDSGGTMYVIVNGRVGIERSGTRKGSYARLATLGPHSYFGEMTLFDNGPRSAAAVTLQDTLTLRLRREPVIALARQYPDLSLELISVLSQRLRECNNRIAELTRTRPRELHKLFDQFD